MLSIARCMFFPPRTRICGFFIMSNTLEATPGWNWQRIKQKILTGRKKIVPKNNMVLCYLLYKQHFFWKDSTSEWKWSYRDMPYFADLCSCLRLGLLIVYCYFIISFIFNAINHIISLKQPHLIILSKVQSQCLPISARRCL